jgi:hypothetical protein
VSDAPIVSVGFRVVVPFRNEKVRLILAIGIIYNDTVKIQKIVQEFDSYLYGWKLQFEAVVIGGAALNLLGVVSRFTRDCDVLDPEIPAEILIASREFAAKIRGEGGMLRDDWFNNGPESLKRTLPQTWQRNIQLLYAGKALKLHTVGRADLLKSKLFALCDRGTDRDDCLRLKPTREELIEALPWVKDQDANLDWPKHVEETLTELAKVLGYVF